MTTTHLVIESSRSFDYPISTRVPERPALADIIDYFLAILLLSIHFFVYSVLLGYEPEGSPSQYISFLLLCQLSYTNLRYIASYLSTYTRYPLDRASHLVLCPKSLRHWTHQVSHLVPCPKSFRCWTQQVSHLVPCPKSFRHWTHQISHLVPCPKFLLHRTHQASHLTSCPKLLSLRQRTHLVQT